MQKNRKFLLFKRDLLLLMFETSLLGFDGRAKKLRMTKQRKGGCWNSMKRDIGRGEHETVQF